MIITYTFTCPRDAELCLMSVDSQNALHDNRLAQRIVVLEHGVDLATAHMARLNLLNCQIMRREKGFERGQHWWGTLIKRRFLEVLRKQCTFDADHWIVSVDSDTVFISPAFFDHLIPPHGLVGCFQNPPGRMTSWFGEFRHASGSALANRSDVQGRILDLNQNEMKQIERELYHEVGFMNEDVSFSYMALRCGAMPHNVEKLWTGDLDIYARTRLLNGKSVCHLTRDAGVFMDVPITGKWEIPSILRKLDLYPW